MEKIWVLTHFISFPPVSLAVTGIAPARRESVVVAISDVVLFSLLPPFFVLFPLGDCGLGIGLKPESVFGQLYYSFRVADLVIRGKQA